MHYYNDIIKFRNLNSGNALNKKREKNLWKLINNFFLFVKGNSMVFEDLEPQKRELKPKDLTNWNIEELEQYIANMKLEIARVETVIKNKRRVSKDAGSLFKQ